MAGAFFFHILYSSLMRLFCSISSSVTAEDAAAMVARYSIGDESYDESFADEEGDGRVDTCSLDYLEGKWGLRQRGSETMRSKNGGSRFRPAVKTRGSRERMRAALWRWL